MQHVARDGWTLVRSDTKAPVCRGDAVVSGRGEPATVAGGAPPHKPASTGRVYVVEGADLANGSHYSREYFPSVFGLEWVRPIRPSTLRSDPKMNIDWAMLQTQKLTLLHVIDHSLPTVAKDLTGILHLIDAIQDKAAIEHGSETVFGQAPDTEE